MKRTSVFSILAVLVAVVCSLPQSRAIAQNVVNYMEQGGARWVIGGALDVASGGQLDVESGGAVDVESGATLDIESGGALHGAGRVLVRESFDQPYFIMQDDATPKSVTDAEVNVVFGSPSGIVTFREELTKTVSSWIIADGVLDISADDTTDNEGVEIVLGWTTTNEGWIVAGTSGACFTVNFTVADISGTDQFVIGWRQNEAFQDVANYAGYSDWSVVGINNVDGSVFALNEIEGGGTLSDDSGTNLADASTATLKSCISAAGVPSAYLNGTAITLTNGAGAKTAAEQHVPFISYLAAGTDGPDITINYWEVTTQ